jgi:hypothetical protein
MLDPRHSQTANQAFRCSFLRSISDACQTKQINDAFILMSSFAQRVGLRQVQPIHVRKYLFPCQGLGIA